MLPQNDERKALEQYKQAKMKSAWFFMVSISLFVGLILAWLVFLFRGFFVETPIGVSLLSTSIFMHGYLCWRIADLGFFKLLRPKPEIMGGLIGVTGAVIVTVLVAFATLTHIHMH